MPNAIPILTGLSIPHVVDLSNGAKQLTITGEASNATKVTIFIDKMISSTNGKSISMFSLGYFSGVGTFGDGFTFTDSFIDGTPSTANSIVTLSPVNSPGIYSIKQMWVQDADGRLNVYSNSQLAALGVDTGFTIVNSNAPAPPTETIIKNINNYVVGNQPVISGTAQAGSEVEVTAYATAYQVAGYVSFGSTRADANGAWSLTASIYPYQPLLTDGIYTEVTAKVIDAAGNASAPSAALSFNVKVNGQNAPIEAVTKDIHNHVAGNQPVISGTAEVFATVTVFNGSASLGSTNADASGWWGIIPGALNDGSYSVTAIAIDGAGHVSPASAPMSFSVDTHAPAGFTFSIASLTNTTSSPDKQIAIQQILNEIGARFSAVFDGHENIPLDVTIVPYTYFSASAAAGWTDAVQIKGSSIPPLVGSGVLNASDALMSYIAPDSTVQLTSSALYTLTHEMMHVLGFNQTIKYNQFVRYVDGIPYFDGPNATAVNGGMVKLDSSIAHLADPNDNMSSGGGDSNSYNFSMSNPNAPFSVVDMAIFKDLGYTNKYTLVSMDGHTFIPGDGSSGNNIVTGGSGIDTLVYTSKYTDFSIVKTSSGYTVTDNIGNGGSEILSGIERIQFSDMAIQTRLVGGAGNDTFSVDVAGDMIVESAGAGIDQVNVAFSTAGTYTLADNVENATVTAAAVIPVNLVGNDLDNILIGNGGGNTLAGGGGNDTLIGNDGADVFHFSVSGNGIDTIKDFTVGDVIEITQMNFVSPPTAGVGATLAQGQIQISTSGNVTTLSIGTDATPGADVTILLDGVFSASQFYAHGSAIGFNHAATGNVTISGIASAGQTLTAATTLADADGLGSISYQWQADGSNISGAVANTFVVNQAQAGKAITVIASYTDGHGTLESVSGGFGKSIDLLAYGWKAHTLLDGVSISGAGHSAITDAGGAASFTAVAETSLALFASHLVVPAEAAATYGAVNLQDAIAILKMIVGLDVNGPGHALSPYQSLAADFDGNGTVGLSDAIGVLKHVVGLSSPEPAWHFVNEADLSMAGKIGLSPGIPPSTISADLGGSSPVHVGLVGYLSGDVDGSYAGANGALDLDLTQPGYFTSLIAGHVGLNPAQFGIYG